MKDKVFLVIFGLIILAALRFYYIECESGFDESPVITTKENRIYITPIED